ncbi:hypothetical protein KI387_032542 [Taxus chinensis]|uniref:Clp R domain-containing protein n=1 Tax=Taxus chinensis TaxID=29808 RepID=A0AA38BPJ9_TAXCH|nr:hypothetical protein KI387_032542 [Taxus chinensis]
MRSGGFTQHHALTVDAASVMRNAVGMARVRGHAQATPLHVAATLLASESGLLRRACLLSHRAVAPLQWRALEVCFNVALNRLPAAINRGQASLSNALVAALKRAQAQQRRGCIEQQQAQPGKVDMEELLVSILDDPSVSRVMREAGFHTTLVKESVEETLRSYNYAGINSPSVGYSCRSNQKQHLPELSSLTASNPSPAAESFSKDMKSLLEALASPKRTNTAILGEETHYANSIIREMMVCIDSGNVPDGLKSVQFISPQVFSSLPLSKDEAERKLAELNRDLNKLCWSGGVILYVGDLRWTLGRSEAQDSNSSYSSVEHVIMEVGRMLRFYTDRLSLLGSATYETYMRCRTGKPSLETQWRLQPMVIPPGRPRLCLQSSVLAKDHKAEEGENCCSNSFPSWLQQYKKDLTCTKDSPSLEVHTSGKMSPDLSKKWSQNGVHIGYACSSNTNENSMIEDSHLQQQSSLNSTIKHNVTVENFPLTYSGQIPSDLHWSIMGSSSLESIEKLTKNVAAACDESESRADVETALTLGRSSPNDHDSDSNPSKRIKKQDDGQIWWQKSANASSLWAEN